jgi:hypothetical protein
MPKFTRVTTMNGNEYMLEPEEAKRLAAAKVKGMPVFHNIRLDIDFIPSQVIDFTSVWMADQPDLLALEAGATAGTSRPKSHAHIVGKDRVVRCSCGRRVKTMLAKRRVTRSEYKPLAGAPGAHFLYEDEGMIFIAETRFACDPARLPEGVVECSQAEYERLRPKVAWLQNELVEAA